MHDRAIKQLTETECLEMQALTRIHRVSSSRGRYSL